MKSNVSTKDSRRKLYCEHCHQTFDVRSSYVCPVLMRTLDEKVRWQILRHRTRLMSGVEQLSSRRYADHYFLKTKETLERDKYDPEVTMQFFCKEHGIVSGIAAILSMLKYQLRTQIANEEWNHLAARARMPDVFSLVDGEQVDPREPVLRIVGNYRYFGWLETVIDGILARHSLVATNTRRCVRAANGKPVVWFGARHDLPETQRHDGYATTVAGASGLATDAGGWWTGVEPSGTMPHALIACYNGDTSRAAARYAQHLGHESDGDISILVDYDNDVLRTSLESIKHVTDLGYNVRSVRVDTSGDIVDKCFRRNEPGFPSDYRRYRGVNVTLVQRLREALDQNGHEEVEIFVSGGFTPEKIAKFEHWGAPVDGYGVGSSILGHGSEDGGIVTGMDFTADIVRVNGSDEAKVGRSFTESKRLVWVDWEDLDHVT